MMRYDAVCYEGPVGRREGCALRDGGQRAARHGIVVLGIARDRKGPGYSQASGRMTRGGRRHPTTTKSLKEVVCEQYPKWAAKHRPGNINKPQRRRQSRTSSRSRPHLSIPCDRCARFSRFQVGNPGFQSCSAVTFGHTSSLGVPSSLVVQERGEGMGEWSGGHKFRVLILKRVIGASSSKSTSLARTRTSARDEALAIKKHHNKRKRSRPRGHRSQQRK